MTLVILWSNLFCCPPGFNFWGSLCFLSIWYRVGRKCNLNQIIDVSNTDTSIHPNRDTKDPLRAPRIAALGRHAALVLNSGVDKMTITHVGSSCDKADTVSYATHNAPESEPRVSAVADDVQVYDSGNHETSITYFPMGSRGIAGEYSAQFLKHACQARHAFDRLTKGLNFQNWYHFTNELMTYHIDSQSPIYLWMYRNI